VYLIESSPAAGGRARLHTRPYALPGDKFAMYELNLFDVAGRKQIKPDVDRLELDWETPRLHWRQDQRHFAYQKVDRGHQRFRVIEVDSHTGRARNLIDERTETFIWTAHTENLGLRLVTWLDKSDDLIYASERDGWRHLYFVDGAKGEIRNQITKGPWVVHGIDVVDEDAQQIWFYAGGRNMTSQSEIGISEFSHMFDKALAEIQAKGHAEVGDKTVVDALYPMVVSLRQSSESALPFKEALRRAYLAAEEGKEASKNYVAKFGKAKTLGERAIGFPDPGAVSLSLIAKAMSDWAEKNL